MRIGKLTGCFGLGLTPSVLGASPGLGQSGAQVEPVFEHEIPNIEGKSLVALVVNYAPGGKSPAHHHAPLR